MSTRGESSYIVWDIILSIVVWLITAAFIGISSFIAIFSLAFIDYCPPQSCSSEAAFSCLFAAGAASVVVAIAGFISGLVRMLRGATSWWLTVGAFVLCAACWGVGFITAARAAGW